MFGNYLKVIRKSTKCYEYVTSFIWMSLSTVSYEIIFSDALHGQWTTAMKNEQLDRLTQLLGPKSGFLMKITFKRNFRL